MPCLCPRVSIACRSQMSPQTASSSPAYTALSGKGPERELCPPLSPGRLHLHLSRSACLPPVGHGHPAGQHSLTGNPPGCSIQPVRVLITFVSSMFLSRPSPYAQLHSPSRAPHPLFPANWSPCFPSGPPQIHPPHCWLERFSSTD